ncbi:MAG: efflux RND transporter periplasmic adaptor subunit [Gammaproteobacteria bacterium]|nr:efflux RND transporter periplasmic adaptor subunit [Gammaproteobacteria bacterium]
MKLTIPLLLIIATALSLITACSDRQSEIQKGQNKKETRPQAVEVTAVRTGSISQWRLFNGSLEASADAPIAAEIGGRLERLRVGLGDRVQRDTEVALIDSISQRHALIQAEAELAVARASYREAQSLLSISQRELERLESLSQKGVSTLSQLDQLKGEFLARQSRVEVTRAEVVRSETGVAIAQTQLQHGSVRALWQQGESARWVAELFVTEGEMVQAHTPLLRVVALDPLLAVFHLAEGDYRFLHLGQEVEISAIAWPEERFKGTVRRIAPALRRESRQARVEIEVANGDFRLKPGMSVAIRVQLQRLEAAQLIPFEALTTRRDERGVFVLDPDQRVRWLAVTPGIEEGGWVAVAEQNIEGEVVTLGQQLIEDGATVVVTRPAAQQP